MIIYILAIWGVFVSILLLILKIHYTRKKKKDDFDLLNEVKNTFIESGLVKLPTFYVSGYIDLTWGQLDSEYVTIDFREPIKDSVIQQINSLNDEHREYWIDLGNGFYHYNKDIDYGMQAISFTICKGATRILIRHFMS